MFLKEIEVDLFKVKENLFFCVTLVFFACLHVTFFLHIKINFETNIQYLIIFYCGVCLHVCHERFERSTCLSLWKAM